MKALLQPIGAETLTDFVMALGSGFDCGAQQQAQKQGCAQRRSSAGNHHRLLHFGVGVNCGSRIAGVTGETFHLNRSTNGENEIEAKQQPSRH